MLFIIFFHLLLGLPWQENNGAKTVGKTLGSGRQQFFKY